MKRLVALFILLFFFTLNSSSQVFKNLNLALKGGASLPVMEFAEKNLDKGSFALTGFHFAAEINASVNNNFIAFIESGMTLNPIDVGYLGYEKVKADPFLSDVYIRSDAFQVVHLLAGPGYQHIINNKFKLIGKAGAGLFFSSTPYQLYKPEYFLLGPPYYEITPSRDVSFAYSAALFFIYNANPYYQIGISTGIKRSKASFDFYSGSNLRTEVRNITILDLSLTLILRLYDSTIQ